MADRILLLRSLVAEAQRESRAQIQVTRKTLDLSREGIASTRALIEKAKQTIEQSRVHLAPNKSARCSMLGTSRDSIARSRQLINDIHERNGK
jgi:hypothetical protein